VATTTRAERIAKLVRSGIASAIRKNGEDGDLGATVLPAIREKVAADLGGIGADYYGTADPVYYREVGARRPLVSASGKALVAEDGKLPAKRVLVAAVRARRDAGGRLARWNVLAASATAALGRTVSEREVKALYAASGRDLDASYTGRGTRAGAAATRPENEGAGAAVPTA
jgi:hypothetical protein